MELNDKGRIGLGERVGPAATSVEGLLQSQTDSVYLIQVSSVAYVNGQSNRWNGEQLTVRKDFIKDLSERKFSRSRSTLAGAALAAGVVLFAISRNLLGFGNSSREPVPGGGNGQ